MTLQEQIDQARARHNTLPEPYKSHIEVMMARVIKPFPLDGAPTRSQNEVRDCGGW